MDIRPILLTVACPAKISNLFFVSCRDSWFPTVLTMHKHVMHLHHLLRPNERLLQYKLRTQNHDLTFICKTSYYDSCNYIVRMLFREVYCLLLFHHSFFTARCTLVQSAVLRSHVVSLSVRLSETLVDCDHIGWNSSEIISPLVSLGCSLSADPNIRGLFQGEHPENLAQIDPPLLI